MEKLPSNIGWCITKCRAYQHHRSGQYVFWVVDYDMYDVKKLHILEMRNKGLCKTKYFLIEKEALDFLKTFPIFAGDQNAPIPIYKEDNPLYRDSVGGELHE